MELVWPYAICVRPYQVPRPSTQLAACRQPAPSCGLSPEKRTREPHVAPCSERRFPTTAFHLNGDASVGFGNGRLLTHCGPSDRDIGYSIAEVPPTFPVAMIPTRKWLQTTLELVRANLSCNRALTASLDALAVTLISRHFYCLFGRAPFPICSTRQPVSSRCSAA